MKITDKLTERVKAILGNRNPHKKLSEKYNIVNTFDIIKKFEEHGFEMYEVRTAGARTNDNYATAKHIVMMHDANATRKDYIHQVVIFNSHNGNTSFQLFAGQLRFVCMNGLIAGEETVPTLKVIHTNQKWEEQVEQFIKDYEKAKDETDRIYQKMMDKNLTEYRMAQFCEEAMKLRHGKEAVDYRELNLIRRKEDEGNSLYLVFNRVQEALMEGHYRIYTIDPEDKVTVKIKSAKRLTDISKIIDVNKKLHDLAVRNLKF